MVCHHTITSVIDYMIKEVYLHDKSDYDYEQTEASSEGI